MTAAYPLTWPHGVPRTRHRERSRFQTSLAGALANVEKSLKAFGNESGKAVSGIVLSSNVTLGKSNPDDPGIAVWFTWVARIRRAARKDSFGRRRNDRLSARQRRPIQPIAGAATALVG